MTRLSLQTEHMIRSAMVNQRQFFRCHLDSQQPATVLVVGRRRLTCQLIEMSLGGFAVVVPKALPLLKQPLARLKIGELDYIVKVTREEPRSDGVLVALEQVEEVLPNNTMIPATPFSRCLTAVAWCAAVGIVVAALYCMSADQLSNLLSFRA